VVVAHDAVGAAAAEAVRDRGAHAVWRFRVRGPSRAPARQAREFLQGLAGCVDAYVLSWFERGARGEPVERVTAAMPSAAIVAAKEFPARWLAEEPRCLAWQMALAEIVRTDREECVGGRLHPRPTVAAR
jgi:hypothetical protein